VSEFDAINEKVLHSSVAAIRRADVRFLAPTEVQSVALVRASPEWREGFERAGVRVADGRVPRVDLVVADASRLDEAARLEAEVLVVEGRATARRLSALGYARRRYVVRPSLDDPSLVIAEEHPRAAGYALLRATGSASGWKRCRNAAAASLLRRGIVPAKLLVVHLGFRQPGPPLIVRAGAEVGIPPDAGWYLTLGRGDQLSRNAFHLFAPDASSPSWVLKFVRLRGYRDPFDRDERGLAHAAESPIAAARAPRLLGRFEIGGIPASVETSAHGEPLKRLLERSPRASLAHVERIADWIVELARSTRAAPETLADERLRLVREVVPRWSTLGAEASLVELLPPIAPVLQHNDLGSWNIFVSDGSFTVVDWESARRHGLPLWDLAYFLTDALATVEDIGPGGWESFVEELYGGRLRHSGLLFAWIRRAVEATEIPPGAVGPILTLGWMHHGLSHVARGDALSRTGALGYPSPPPLGKLARVWLRAPTLGPTWSRWQNPL
jgi:hypothetical protein